MSQVSISNVRYLFVACDCFKIVNKKTTTLIENMSITTSEKTLRKGDESAVDNDRNQSISSRESSKKFANSQFGGDLLDYKNKYNELATALQDFYDEFKPYAMNEV